ncbi:MAG: hypothetical protein NTW87_12595 [Planctomycetota bacterium]|nr:hypothetical protein [Planctomycetota bacterium]
MVELVATCAGCGKRYKGLPSAKKYKCTGCQNIFTFPEAPRSAAPGKVLCSNCWTEVETAADLHACPGCGQKVSPLIGGNAASREELGNGTHPSPLLENYEKAIASQQELEAKVAEMREQLAAALAARDQAQAIEVAARQERDVAQAARDEATTAEGTARQERDAALRERDEALKARDEAAQLRDRAVASQEEAVRAADEALKACDEAVKTRDEALKTRDEALQTRDEAVKTRDEAFKIRNEALQARDEAAKTCDEALKTRDEALQARDEALRICDEAMKARESAVADRDLALKARDEAQALSAQRGAEAARAREELEQFRDTAVRVLEPLGQDYSARMQEMIAAADELRAEVKRARDEVAQRMDHVEHSAADLRDNLKAVSSDVHERLCDAIGVSAEDDKTATKPLLTPTGPLAELLAAGVPPEAAIVTPHRPQEQGSNNVSAAAV